MPSVPSHSKRARSKRRKVLLGMVMVCAWGSLLPLGCASSDRNRADARTADLRPSETPAGGATDGETALAPWRSSTAPPTTVVLNGSTASYQAFVHGNLEFKADEVNVHEDMHPQEWAQAGAPRLSTLTHRVRASPESGAAAEAPAFEVQSRVDNVALPSGRQFLSLSFAVQAPEGSTALAPSLQAPVGRATSERILVATTAAAADIDGLPTADEISREAMLRPGAQKILLVTTNAPAYAVREWTLWAQNAASRGTEVSLWLRPKTAAGALAGLRALVAAGGGQLWIGGAVEDVLTAWRQLPLATLDHATLHLKFDPHRMRRHRVVASAVARSRLNNSARWRLSTVYSVVVELGLQENSDTGETLVDDGSATLTFAGPNSRVHRAQIPLSRLREPDQNLDLDGNPSARQVALALAAESLRGMPLSLEDQKHLSHLELDANPRVQQRLQQVLSISNGLNPEPQPNARRMR